MSRAVVPRAHRATELGYGRGWLLRNLPLVLQEDDLLARFVTIVEDVATSVRHAVVSVERVADVTTAPPAMVSYLGAWVSAPAAAAIDDVAHRRRIVAAAGATLALRGTAGGLRTLLSAVTGGPVEVVDSGGVHRAGATPPVGAPTVTVFLTTCGPLRPSEVVELVRAELPAHVAMEIRMGEEHLWPSTISERPPLATPSG